MEGVTAGRAGQTVGNAHIVREFLLQQCRLGLFTLDGVVAVKSASAHDLDGPRDGLLGNGFLLGEGLCECLHGFTNRISGRRRRRMTVCRKGFCAAPFDHSAASGRRLGAASGLASSWGVSGTWQPTGQQRPGCLLRDVSPSTLSTPRSRRRSTSCRRSSSG